MLLRIEIRWLSVPRLDNPDVHAEVLAEDLSERRAGDDSRDAEFFAQLSSQRRVGGFAVLDVAARKVPAVGIPASRWHAVKQ